MVGGQANQGEVKSASRVLTLIELLSQSESGLTFSEIADLSSLPRSSLHGLLQTMIGHQALELDPHSKRYSIGLRLWEAGHAYSRRHDLSVVAQPFMDSARDRLHETLHVAILDGLEIVYIAKADANQQLVLSSQVGGRRPAHATGLGKMLLATLAPEEIDRRLGSEPLARYTASTITDLEVLKDELAAVIQRGYATDVGEHVEGIRCLAVPVYDEQGICAAMSVSVPEVRWKLAREHEFLQVLQDAGRGLSRKLGHVG